MLTTHTPDSCCAEVLSEALRTDSLRDEYRWFCPKCGTEWRPEVYRLDSGEIEGKHWQPHCPVLVFRP